MHVPVLVELKNQLKKKINFLIIILADIKNFRFQVVGVSDRQKLQTILSTINKRAC